MLSSLTRRFYPDLQKEELKKFTLLAVTFFLVIGAYWLLRLLKDTIFFTVAFPEVLGWDKGQGAKFQPIAKAWSVGFVVFMVLIYSKLVDLFKKHQLFYIICGFYSLVFALITGAIFMVETHGPASVGYYPLAAAGWASYLLIESFGSLIVALFWSFTNSITKTDSAKRGYPLVIMAAQFGAILGSGLNVFSDKFGNIWPLFLIATLCVIAIMFMISYFMKVTPADQMVGNEAAAASEKPKEKEGFLKGFTSGLVLLFTRPYLFGVLIVSTLYEAAGEIVNYQMKAQAAQTVEYSSSIGFNWFMGIFGVATNALSFAIALLGTSYIIKTLGTRKSLLIYPVSFGITLILLFVYFKSGASGANLLWATFVAMMIIKGASYAVNNPTKEMMYIPTSKNAKFKAKGWVDMFGSRTAKMGGAQVNNMFKHNLTDLMIYGTAASLGLIGVWLVAAIYVGTRNEELVEKGQIID